MATADVSSDSDGECEILSGLNPGRIPVAYAWQPTRPAASSSSDSDSWTSASSEESGSEGGASDRMENVGAWCRCGLCETDTLSQEKEAICCASVSNCLKRMAEGLWNIYSCFMIIQNLYNVRNNAFEGELYLLFTFSLFDLLLPRGDLATAIMLHCHRKHCPVA